MDFDVIVVGAGPGGCLVARDLARSGLRVALMDRHLREDLGLSVTVEVEKAMLQKVGLSLPQGDESVYNARCIRFFAACRQEMFALSAEHAMLALRLDLFVRRLLVEAETAGCHFFENYRANKPLFSGSRVCGVQFDTPTTTSEIRARLIIDASGYNAVLVRQLKPEFGIEFCEQSGDIVIAENHVHRIDVEEARKAVSRGRHGDQEIWTVLSPYGNYSTRFSHLSLADGRAYILIGLKLDSEQSADLGQLLANFRDEQGYYADAIHGGRALIRIRRSLDQLVAPSFMVLGEAASQVHPMQGSGVSSALYAGQLAARVAAEALQRRQFPTTADLWAYSSEYHRGRGAVLASYDANRRVIESLSPALVSDLNRSGLLQPEDIQNAFIPRKSSISCTSLPPRILGLLRHPHLALVLPRMAYNMHTAYRHHTRYPTCFVPEELRQWQNRLPHIFKFNKIL